MVWDYGLLAIAFESFQEFDDPTPGRHAAWIIVSNDGGKTFSSPLQVAQHSEHKVYDWDQRLCRGKQPGKFFATFWTHHRVEQKDLTVHWRRAVVEGETLRLDPIQDTAIPGQISAPSRRRAIGSVCRGLRTTGNDVFVVFV